ncbi:ovochymase-like [Microplitis mediator]|uniref:ovochymase-like n=1 Tax=Microplitis mediator TaxID=375433 RepID=UPI0025566522|nr:ovochymase-like [Microplitis mediator]
MFILLCLFFFLSIAAEKNNFIRPINNNTRLKIINGHPINIELRPFMVSLHCRNFFICGGSIISSSWVLTAQHCINPQEPLHHYYIRAGSVYYYQGQIYYLSRIEMINTENESANNGSSVVDYLPKHDIVLLKMTRKFKYSSTIKPAKLPINDEIPHYLWASGWGLTESNEPSTKLRIVGLTKIPYNACFNISSYSRVLLNDHHICFGSGGYDSCSGDSGGPLANYDTIYGIVSFGITKCGFGPGVYEKVSFYSDWINYIINT